ncbi:MAG: hypothetical protein K1X57_06340 [Gemmataceae bacterium]|nr:hypothetical protein [Gemmataceae bacterium]
MIRLLALVIVATPIVVALADDPPATKPQVRFRRPATNASLTERQRDVVQKLHETIRFDRAFENVPLKDILDFLGDRSEMTIVIDYRSFREAFGEANVGEQQIRLSKLGITTPRQVLEYVLNSIDGGFLIRGDHVEVVHHSRLLREVFGKLEMPTDEADRTLLPIAHIAARNEPLSAVFAGIADQTGRNVVIDPRVNEKMNGLVTMRLLNTPVDTAVTTLAQMYDLVAVPVDNTFVITARPLAAGFVAVPADLKPKRK